MKETTDRELWDRADREPEVFGVLFERHARAVYNFCFRRTADWALAEDLTSNVFFTAWRRRTEIRISSESESALPWLLGVATNLLRNQGRSRRRFANAALRLGNRDRSEQVDFAPDSIEKVADEQEMRLILDRMRFLSQEEVEILALFAWQGLSYAEIANILRLPLGTVRSRLARARASLRELTAAEGHEGGRAAALDRRRN